MFNFILATLRSAFALTSALAVPDREVTTHKLVPMNLCVKMCVDVNFGGECKNLCGSPGLCCKPSPLQLHSSPLMAYANDLATQTLLKLPSPVRLARCRWPRT